jgi:hypothetical protein
VGYVIVGTLVTIGFGYDATQALNGIDTKIVPGSDLPEIGL